MQKNQQEVDMKMPRAGSIYSDDNCRVKSWKMIVWTEVREIARFQYLNLIESTVNIERKYLCITGYAVRERAHIYLVLWLVETGKFVHANDIGIVCYVHLRSKSISSFFWLNSVISHIWALMLNGNDSRAHPFLWVLI